MTWSWMAIRNPSVSWNRVPLLRTLFCPLLSFLFLPSTFHAKFLAFMFVVFLSAPPGAILTLRCRGIRPLSNLTTALCRLKKYFSIHTPVYLVSLLGQLFQGLPTLLGYFAFLLGRLGAIFDFFDKATLIFCGTDVNRINSAHSKWVGRGLRSFR